MTPQEAIIRKITQAVPEQGYGRQKGALHTNTASRLLAIQQAIEETDQPGAVEAHIEANAPRDTTLPLRAFIPVDALALFFGFVISWSVAAVIDSVFFGRGIQELFVSEDPSRLINFALVSAGALLWFEHTGHYRLRMPFWLETQKIVGTLSFAMIIDGFFQFASKQDISRLWLVSSWAVGGFLLLAGRNIARHVMRRGGVWQVRTLLVGSGQVAEDARAALRSEPGLGFEICMQIERLPYALAQAGYSWQNLCAKFGAEYVVIALDAKELSEADAALAQLLREDILFSVSPPLRNMPVLGMTPQYFFNHDVMLMTRNSKLEQPLPRLLKRCVDIVGAGMALIALSPLFVVVSLLVRRDGGPAFFGHKRLGMNGKAFACMKFRSMIANSDEVLQKHLNANPEARKEWMQSQKLQNDPRVTRIGEFLRKTSIDELPQLFNVLKGEMSLVGPRPIVVAETDKYHSDIAHYYRVRPGITGLWQVSGRSDVSYNERVQMDSWYVRNWSFWHDVAIIFKTFP